MSDIMVQFNMFINLQDMHILNEILIARYFFAASTNVKGAEVVELEIRVTIKT